MIDTTKIATVELRASFGQRVLYRVRGENGTVYATNDMFVAALCKQAQAKGNTVRIHHRASGSVYRDIDEIELLPVTTEEHA